MAPGTSGCRLCGRNFAAGRARLEEIRFVGVGHHGQSRPRPAHSVRGDEEGHQGGQELQRSKGESDSRTYWRAVLAGRIIRSLDPQGRGMNRIIRYIEWNPVKACLVERIE